MHAKKYFGRLVRLASFCFAFLASQAIAADHSAEKISHAVFRCEVNGQTVLTDRVQDAANCKALQISPINAADAEVVKSDVEDGAARYSKRKRASAKNKVTRNDDSIAMHQIQTKQHCEKMAQQLEDIDEKMRSGVKLKQQEHLRDLQRDLNEKRSAEHCR
jgi:predicted aspartyl protease